jgi:Mg-chelatase subunit ChlD
MSDTPTVHLHFVLDRSGSMDAIRDDVIGGFNSFVAEQAAQPGECLMTLVQFDNQEPYEVLFDARHVLDIPPLTPGTFQPRGATPLYDAMGRAIANATIRAEQRAAGGEPDEDIVFVTFTDGLENASREYDRDKVFAAVKKREERGWTFVFLGANQDSYAAGRELGYDPRSTQNFAATPDGTRRAFASLSRASSSRRDKLARHERFDKDDYFEGTKEAEA